MAHRTLGIELVDVSEDLEGPSFESLSSRAYECVLLEAPYDNALVDSFFRFQSQHMVDISVWNFLEHRPAELFVTIKPKSMEIDKFRSIDFELFASSLLFQFDDHGFCYTDECRSFVLISGTEPFLKQIVPTSRHVLKRMFFDYAEERYYNVSEKFKNLWRLYVEKSYLN